MELPVRTKEEAGGAAYAMRPSYIAKRHKKLMKTFYSSQNTSEEVLEHQPPVLSGTSHEDPHNNAVARNLVTEYLDISSTKAAAAAVAKEAAAVAAAAHAMKEASELPDDLTMSSESSDDVSDGSDSESPGPLRRTAYRRMAYRLLFKRQRQEISDDESDGSAPELSHPCRRIFKRQRQEFSDDDSDACFEFPAPTVAS